MQHRTPARFLVIIFVMIIFIPNNSTALMGINFNETITTDATNIRIISVNQDQTIIATAYDNSVELHDQETKTIIQKYDFASNIFDIEFAPNGKLLAVNVRDNSGLGSALQIIDTETLEILDLKHSGHNHPANIDWSPDGEKLLISTNTNEAKILYFANMTTYRTLTNQHPADVTCLKYSKTGKFILTGDNDGNLVLWDSKGTYLNVSVNLGSKITECEFSKSDVKFAAINSNGDLISYAMDGTPLKYDNFVEIYDLLWSDNGDSLYILKSDTTPEFILLDGSTFEEKASVNLIHKSVDFTVIESNSNIEKVYIATDINHVAIYQRLTAKHGYGQAGPDLDGDGIPNTIDLDDDGDSHRDIWDINCPLGIDCKNHADNNTIRQYFIEFLDQSIVIDDIYTMDLLNTYSVRNLTMRSIISDRQVSYEEATMFENAICANMDINLYLDRLKDSIELSSGQLINGSLQCIVYDGLSLSNTFDPEPIKFGFRATFDISPNLSLPISVIIQNQISISDSSITHLVENSPILVNKININGDIENYFWEKNSQLPELNFTALNSSKSNLDNFISHLQNHLLLISVGIAGFCLICWAVIRRKNMNSAIIFDEDFVTEEQYSNAEDTMTKPAPISIKEIPLDEDISIIDSNVIPQEEKPLQRKAFTLDEDEEYASQRVIKRRAGKIQRNTQGPIMSTKRKRLDGKLDVPGVKIVPNKKAVSSKKIKKVRKVKRYDD